MKSVDLRSLRAKLPKGSIVRIADAMGVEARVVSAVLNKGWYPERHNEVLKYGLGIIRDMYPDDDLLREAEELGVTGGSVLLTSRKKYRARNNPGVGAPIFLVLGVGLVASYFLIPAVKKFVNDFVLRVSGRGPVE